MRAAARRGTATTDDLRSGAAWRDLLTGLQHAGELVAGDDAAVAAGYRHLLVMLALGIDEALRWSDPSDPHLGPGPVDTVLKWGMDCPDAAYLGCPVRGDGSYVISGERGTVRYLGFQVMGGMANLGNVVADDLDIDRDGRFELTLSAQDEPGNWMRLPADASSLVVRQFFYDWEREDAARLTVSRLGATSLPQQPPALDGATVARQLVALGEFAEEGTRFWRDVEAAGRAAGLNRFRTPDARTDIGGAEENVSVWGSWELAEDEALIIEVRPPPALYWSVSLGNPWWETLDYANHQTSLNGHQAVIDEDGAFRAVVAHVDPGVANWLDTTGQSSGPMIFRWLRADGTAPVPATRVVPLAKLDDELPMGTARMGPGARARSLAARRAGARRRFTR